MQIITVAVIKGGTGKTTTAAALAQAAAADKKKVLAIDLDPQANLSLYLGADQNRPGGYELLHGTDPAELIQTTEQGIDVITGSPDLATETTRAGSGTRLRDALEPLKRKYALIIIDTPPQLGELTYNALLASTRLIIPLQAEPGSLQGLYQIADVAHQIQGNNPRLKISGTILTSYDNRPKINRTMKEAIENAGRETGAPLLAAIRAGIPIKEAQALQRSLYEYAPRCKPAGDYLQLYKLITSKK